MDTIYDLDTNKDQLTSSSFKTIFEILEKESLIHKLIIKTKNIDAIIYSAKHKQDVKNFFCEKVEGVVNDFRQSLSLEPSIREMKANFERFSSDEIDINKYVEKMATLACKSNAFFYMKLKELLLQHVENQSTSR